MKLHDVGLMLSVFVLFSCTDKQALRQWEEAVEERDQIIAEQQIMIEKLEATIEILEASKILEPLAQSEPDIKKVYQPQDVDTRDFRQAQWGMSRDEIVELEGQNPAKEGKNVEGFHYLAYSTVLVGNDTTYETLLLYYFVKDQFFVGRYNITESHSNTNEYLTDFDGLKNILTEKYGDPEERTVWNNDLYKDNKERWGLAITTGDLEKYATWHTAKTEIILQLKGDNYDVNFAIRYTSKDTALQQAVKAQENKVKKSAL